MQQSPVDHDNDVCIKRRARGQTELRRCNQRRPRSQNDGIIAINKISRYQISANNFRRHDNPIGLIMTRSTDEQWKN